MGLNSLLATDRWQQESLTSEIAFLRIAKTIFLKMYNISETFDDIEQKTKHLSG